MDHRMSVIEAGLIVLLEIKQSLIMILEYMPWFVCSWMYSLQAQTMGSPD